MKIAKNSVPITLLALLIAGCTGKEADTVSASQPLDSLLTTPTMAEYAKVRKMSARSDERQREAYDAFVIRNKVAEYLARQTLSKDIETRIRILDERNRILLKKYFDDYTDAQLNDDNIQAYYQSNQDKFARHSYELEFALVKRHKIKENEEERYIQQLEAIREKLKSGEALSGISSEDVELGNISLESETADRAIINALSGLDVQDLTPVVFTNRGLQVFRILEKKSTPRPLDEVRESIRYELAQQLKAKEMERLESLVQE